MGIGGPVLLIFYDYFAHSAIFHVIYPYVFISPKVVLAVSPGLKT